MNLQIGISDLGDRCTLLKLAGPLGSNTFGNLEDALREVQSDDFCHIVVDLDAVTYISSAGVGALVIAMMNCREKGGDLVLAAPNDHVHQVLNLLGLCELFKIVPDMAHAVLELE